MFRHLTKRTQQSFEVCIPSYSPLPPKLWSLIKELQVLSLSWKQLHQHNELDSSPADLRAELHNTWAKQSGMEKQLTLLEGLQDGLTRGETHPHSDFYPDTATIPATTK